MRSASLCAYSAEKLFLIEQCRSVCGRSGIAFSREGSWRKTAAAAPLSAKARCSGGKFFADFQRAELPQSKPDGFDSSLREGAFSMARKFPTKAQSLRVGTLPSGELSRSD